jgi:hypothetical protein
MPPTGRWVLLAYRLPREPSTPRIAVWRNLKRLGVAQLLDGLVALPLDSRNRKRLDSAAGEIAQAGGQASTWLAETHRPGRHERELARQLAATISGQYRDLIAQAVMPPPSCPAHDDARSRGCDASSIASAGATPSRRPSASMPSAPSMPCARARAPRVVKCTTCPGEPSTGRACADPPLHVRARAVRVHHGPRRRASDTTLFDIHGAEPSVITRSGRSCVATSATIPRSGTSQASSTMPTSPRASTSTGARPRRDPPLGSRRPAADDAKLAVSVRLDEHRRRATMCGRDPHSLAGEFAITRRGSARS